MKPEHFKEVPIRSCTICLHCKLSPVLHNITNLPMPGFGEMSCKKHDFIIAHNDYRPELRSDKFTCDDWEEK